MVISALFIAAPGIAQDTVPVSWQPGMRLISTSCCGMRPGYDSLVISQDKSYYVNTRGKKNIKKVYHFSQAQLNDLLATLRKKNFGTVSCGMDTEVAYDRESSSFSLEWPSHVLVECVDRPEKLSPAQRRDLSDIYAYLDQLTGKR